MDAKKVRSSGHKPPMGIMYLASCLRTHTSAEVVLLDAQILGMSVEEVVKRVESLRPNLVGITTWTDFWYDICRLADGIKAALPSTHICLGGPHLGIYPRESLSRDSVDSIVVGDGEAPLAHLVRSLSGNKNSRAFPGLYFSEQRDSIERFDPYIEKNLDELPLPNREMLPYRKYDSLLTRGVMTTMVTSRGCPFRCIFCKLNFQKTVLRSAESVVEEMQEIDRLKIEEIEIYDDTFGTDRRRVFEICRLMRKKGLRFRMTIRDRVSNIDDEVLAALKEVGLLRVYLGVESASDKTLRRVRKGTTVEMARNAVKYAKKHDIGVLTYFMLGLPGENEEDFERTLKLAIDLDPDYANFSVTIPYPGTELYRDALAKGIIEYDIWKEFVEHPTPDMEMPVYEERYSRAELLQFHRQVIHRFYFRRKYLLNRLRKVRSFSQLFKSGKAALSLWR